jgi:hypothetical protein
MAAAAAFPPTSASDSAKELLARKLRYAGTRQAYAVNGKVIGTSTGTVKVTNVPSSNVTAFSDFEPAAGVDLPKCARLEVDLVSYDFEAYDSYDAKSPFLNSNLEGRVWKTLSTGVFRDPDEQPAGALRYDAGKPRYDLIPSDALEELAKVYAHGCKKYAEDNWTKGMDWRRCLGSLLRHAFAWARGEDLDPESKLHHMAHVAWNALTLVSYFKRKVGKDDRDKT